MTGSRVGRILLERERAARMAAEDAAGIGGEELRSAFAISKEHVLTAWHCVRDAEEREDRLWFRLRDAGAKEGRHYNYLPVRLLGSDETFDVAVLVVDGSRLGEAGLSEGEAAALLAGSAIPLGADVSVHERVRVMGFPANAPSADSDTLPATVVDTALPLGEVTGLKLFGPSLASVDPVDPHGLSGGPVLAPGNTGDAGRGVEVAVGIVRGVPAGRYPDTALGGGLIATRIADVAGRLPEIAAALRANVPGEIVTYLQTLIDWLNTDPWPRDPRFGGSVLTPAAIERKLRITAQDPDREQDLDADGMAQQCRRLVILGGPGAGKTWLARRTARRCAEDALQALAAGGTLDEIELPLYTTCSRLFGAGGDIRQAVVSSALGQLADLGGSRISAALRVFFAERNAPTLLVIDSLDEAHGPSERLRQAGTLPWRIVLTSRASSWRNQLTINDTDDSHRVGELQPLRYPDDVEPFIERWFARHPEQANDLAAQIARRPGLQQAATVPLILAFYCIVGGTGPLPGFRRDLYTKVLNRMLTGRWRGDDDRQPDADTCLHTLRAWAWAGAASNHPVSGVGMWTDDIATKGVRPGEADADALDQVATPLGPPDVDTGETLRRFIHRSIREHLVAEHVASLPLDEAARCLLPHIWYDPDWEYAAPAALAMHPQHDHLLRDLICRAASSDQIPGDLSVIDAGWESRGLLARVAAESSEADWSPEVAGMIGQARVELARSGRVGDLGGAAHWGTSDRQAREALLGLLARATDGGVAARLAGGLAQLDPVAEDKRQAREALLGLLARATDGGVAAGLAGGLAGGLAQVDPVAEDKRQARETLLGLLAGATGGRVAAVLLAGALAQLDPVAEDKRQAREALLGLLARATVGLMAARLAAGLAGALAQLATVAEDKRQAREALLVLLAGESDGGVAAGLAGALAQLDPVAEDKRQAREALLGLLAGESDGGVAARLAGALAQLDPVAEDKRQAREALLVLLAGESDGGVAARLAGALAQLDPVAEDKRQARGALLVLLAGASDGGVAAGLAGALAQLATVAEDKRQAREALLVLLAGASDGGVAAGLAGALAQLDPVAEDKRQAREALLVLLAGATGGWVAEQLAGALAQLATVAEDKRQARGALLVLLAGATDSWSAEQLAGALAQLDPVAEDKRQAREALLVLLAGATDSWSAEQLAGALAQLDPVAEDKRQARGALLVLLRGETNPWVAVQLAGRLAQLDPTVHDLRTWRAWAVRPAAELLAAVRRNSALTNWLAALPSLTSLSDSPA